MAVYIPDTSDESLMKCAISFTSDGHFTAEQFCQRLYKAEFGYGPFIAGKLRRLVNKGSLIKVGKKRGKTLYAVPREEYFDDPPCPECGEPMDGGENDTEFCMECGWPVFHEDDDEATAKESADD